jgi:hypothetical protein
MTNEDKTVRLVKAIERVGAAWTPPYQAPVISALIAAHEVPGPEVLDAVIKELIGGR